MGFYDFEMPTPCRHCGKVFDLNDGGSSKRYKNIIICPDCHRSEEDSTVQVKDLRKNNTFIWFGDEYTVERRWISDDYPLMTIDGSYKKDFYDEYEEVLKTGKVKKIKNKEA